MAYSSIAKPGDHFNTVTYTANASGQSITGVGFQPDWLWIKSRSAAYNWAVRDVLRGSTVNLRLNSTNADQTQSDSVTSFDSDGFTLGADSSSFVNQNGETYASWNWKANGSSTTTPSGGTITTTASVNTTAAFSVFTYTGNGSAAHIAHGLGVAPTFVAIKGRSNVDNWFVKHPGLASNEYIYFNSDGAKASGSNVWSNTNPDATKIYIGTDAGVNGSGETYVCYAFAEIKGYSKFGSYTGNGSTSGPFVYTGFRPAFVLMKRTDGSNSWCIFDNKRATANPAQHRVFPDTSDAEVSSTGNAIDILSNGFKGRSSGSTVNNDGGTYIYMAFAEHPFVGNDSGTAVPVVAR
jgi:hypothetical protein